MTCLVAGGLAAAAAAQERSLRWAAQGDVSSLDPHALAEGFQLAFLGNVYDGLVRRGRDLGLEPALAVSWRNVEPTVWRFELRRGVTFHDGTPFTADDVVFSLERAKAQTAGVRGMLAPVLRATKVDDYTVDLVTPAPDPILPQSLPNWLIVPKRWAEANDAATPHNLAGGAENFATRNANGTGPFRIVERRPGEQTLAEPSATYWEAPEHNLTRVRFRPIASDPTRLAALISREVDLIMPVPLQNIERLEQNAEIAVLQAPELRTIFLGFDVARKELLYSSVKGRNPLKDLRVRRAIELAIDEQAIVRRIMRGAAAPAGLLVGPGIAGFNPALNDRPSANPEAARKLMEEAGYGEGFSLTLDCPNDRYVSDEAICVSIGPMLARIGIRLNVNAMSKSIYFRKLEQRDTSFFLLGWTSGTYDAHHPMRFLLHTADKGRGLGSWNYGGYSNATLDDLIGRIGSEFDAARRQALIDEAHRLVKADLPYLPLHQQALAWAHRKHLSVVQRADDFFTWRWVKVQDR